MAQSQPFDSILAAYEIAFSDLLALAESYPESLRATPGVCGVWSAQEVLAHLSGWIVEAIRRYPRYARGTTDINYNTDAFNDLSVRRRRALSYAAIVDELRAVSSQLAQMARELPQASIAREGRYGEWLTSLTREAHEHGAQLREFAQGAA